MITVVFELNWKLVIGQKIVTLIQNYVHKIALNFCLNTTNTIELSFPGITRIKSICKKKESNPLTVKLYLICFQINLCPISLKICLFTSDYHFL